MKPTRLPTVTKEITLAGLPEAFATLLAGEARGRTVVKITGGES
jgi:NADPH-dependent curcumin reductase CurA